ncbi:M16 family metallopeptidase [Alienimonas californiensis]|uniref:Peptidase M16 inactive domain protein n=1 Tax=Alienimonas californiensis TaxID=2527989 RepID=A0A517PAP3_9PLAN|nr:pitrilysin family protein [Alienimonas californiensis]QDT16436.1 Peptidase M16 inactive domain protein [Alienimonas californiensis]
MRLLPAVAAALAAVAFAPPAPAAPQQDVPMVEGVQHVATVEGISEYRLPNGLKILLFPDVSRPTVTVNCTIFVGSRHEGYGETGMAHLLEHMVFKGTPTFEDVPKELKDRGAVFNGSTWLDRTNYYETLPASDENLEFAIHLEADRLVNSYVKQEDLDSEMTVVRNEFERGENSPQRILMQRMLATAFEWHNYGKSTIGNRADIERVPIENLRAFYERYYQPDNAMLIVAGSFDPEKALQYAKEHFGAIEKPTRVLPQTYTEEPPQDGERTVILRRVGDVAQVGAVYHVPAGPDPAFAAVDVLESILTDNPSGRLYKVLVETKRAASVSGGTFALHDPGVLLFTAEVATANEPQDVLRLMLNVTEGVPAEPVTEEEVARARARLLARRERAANDTSRIAVQLSEWSAQGDWRLYFLYRDRLEEVTAADVQDVAERFLQSDNRTAGLFLPTKEPQTIEIPSRPDLAEMLKDYEGRDVAAAGEAFDPDPAAIEERVVRTELPSGLEVALLPKQTRGDTVDARLSLRYGTEDTLQGLSGATNMLGPLMMRGTAELSKQEIQDRLDELQASLRPGGADGNLTFTITAKRDTLPAVMELLGEILKSPALPPEELELLQQATIAQIEAQKSEPQALAPTEVRRALSNYPNPEDPRYVPTLEEQAKMIAEVTPQEVAAVYNTLLTDASGELAVVGSFDPDAVLELAKENLTGFGAPDAPSFARLPQVPNPDAPSGDKEIATPGKQNAVYYAALQLPISQEHPDYPALMIGDYILGSSGLSSRLGDRVRQQEGLSYGVGSQLTPRVKDELTTFGVYAITNPGNVPKLKTVIREELDRLIAEGVTPAEVDAAKTSYLQKQRVNRASDSQLATKLASQLYNDRTMAFTAELEAQVAALTAEEVNRALREHLDPAELYVVVAGDMDAPDQAPADVPVGVPTDPDAPAPDGAAGPASP